MVGRKTLMLAVVFFFGRGGNGELNSSHGGAAAALLLAALLTASALAFHIRMLPYPTGCDGVAGTRGQLSARRKAAAVLATPHQQNTMPLDDTNVKAAAVIPLEWRVFVSKCAARAVAAGHWAAQRARTIPARFSEVAAAAVRRLALALRRPTLNDLQVAAFSAQLVTLGAGAVCLAAPPGAPTPGAVTASYLAVMAAGVFVVLALRFFSRSFRQRQQVHADLAPPTQQKSTPPAHQSESVERASNLEPRASARYAQRKRKYRHARKHKTAVVGS